MAAITCYASQVIPTYFALPGVVSHIQAAHVLQGEESVRSTPATSGPAIPSLTKLMSPSQLYVSRSGLCLLAYNPPPFRPSDGLFSKFNRVERRGSRGREVACARSLTGSLAVDGDYAPGDCSRSLTCLCALSPPSRTTHVSLNRAEGDIPRSVPATLARRQRHLVSERM